MVSIDWESLRIAHDQYFEAGKLNPYETYALVNLAKLDLLLAAIEPRRKARTKVEFQKLVPLGQYRVEETAKDPEPHWAQFDLADAYLFSGEGDRRVQTNHAAIENVPPEKRASDFTLVASPLESAIAAGVVEEDTGRALRAIFEELKTQRG